MDKGPWQRSKLRNYCPSEAVSQSYFAAVAARMNSCANLKKTAFEGVFAACEFVPCYKTTIRVSANCAAVAPVVAVAAKMESF